MTPQELYQAGRLNEAVAAATRIVKTRPTDTGGRYLLSQLLCISGQLERADMQLTTIGQQSPEAAVSVSLFRQLIRAATWRQEFFSSGHLPEFLSSPPDHVQLHLRASIALRENNAAEATALLQQAAEMRPVLSGQCDSEHFEGMLDPNDMTASLLEVLTSNGKYYWIPFEAIELIELRPLKQPLDLLWRAAHVIVPGGPDGEVYLPATYPDTNAEKDEDLLLARSTDWRGEEGSPVRGVGQRMLLFGETDRPILEINEIRIDQPGR